MLQAQVYRKVSERASEWVTDRPPTITLQLLNLRVKKDGGNKTTIWTDHLPNRCTLPLLMRVSSFMVTQSTVDMVVIREARGVTTRWMGARGIASRGRPPNWGAWHVNSLFHIVDRLDLVQALSLSPILYELLPDWLRFLKQIVKKLGSGIKIMERLDCDQPWWLVKVILARAYSISSWSNQWYQC